MTDEIVKILMFCYNFGRLSDIEKKCGIDSVRYLVFQQYMILLLVIYTVLCIGIILPVNIQGLLGKLYKFT